MEGFANLVSMLDYAVNTRRKRHIHWRPLRLPAVWAAIVI